jgi:flagellar hook-length control protein FliK
MALIPPDAGIRMRMQTEANLLHPLAPAHEVPSDLLDLPPGRVFTARIQEALPENTFRALVAGKTITLSLPEGAKAGDQLELVVVDRSAKSIIARQVEPGTAQTTTAQPYPFTRLSPAAQLISQLLPAEGKTATPAQLNGGQPLLETPPGSQAAGAQLAPKLASAVAQSGLFYESHQAQWVTGKLPLAQLLQEPQGQLSSLVPTPQAVPPDSSDAMPVLAPAPEGEFPAGAPATSTSAEQAGRHNLTPEARAQQPAIAHGQNNFLPTQAGDPEKVGAGGTVTSSGQAAQTGMTAQQVPEELRPIIQQQLEAVATQRVFWHGEIWPQQQIDWEIEWQQQNDAGDGSEPEATWRTALSLTTPRLGQVDATLQLTSSGVRITLATPYGSSAADLRDEAPRLADALAGAGVPLLAFQVKHENEHPAGQG